MSQSVDETLAKKTMAFITGALEPKIAEIIEEANILLKKRGVVIGAEIQWYIDKTQKEDQDEK